MVKKNSFKRKFTALLVDVCEMKTDAKIPDVAISCSDGTTCKSGYECKNGQWCCPTKSQFQSNNFDEENLPAARAEIQILTSPFGAEFVFHGLYLVQEKVLYIRQSDKITSIFVLT